MATQLAERFIASAQDHSSMTALVADGRSLTYGELLAAAEDCADRIRAAATAKARSAVSITVARNQASVIGILGALLSGRPYVPIDGTYPRARQEYMRADSGAVVHIDATGEKPVISPLPAVSRGVRVDPDTVYVLYTSGSSGEPKGCMVTNRNVLSLFDSTAPLFRPDGTDVVSILHSLAFDFSVWELWSALLYGGVAWLAPYDVVRDPDSLVTELSRRGVNRLSVTPSLFSYLVSALRRGEHALPQLRSVVLGGEPIRLADVELFKCSDRAPHASVINMYGITETTVHVTYREISPNEGIDERGTTPIGNPIPSLRLSLRDSNGEEVIPGQSGELWIAGDGVCAGYLNRPELSASLFVTDASGCRWYKSGDTAVYQATEYCYVGRMDRQVQLRGHRIELGEVEAVIETLEGVIQAVATVEERAATGQPMLIAYVRMSGCPISGADMEIIGQLRAVLPPQSVPHRIRLVADIPRNTNGKIDMAALRESIIPS
jgi:amino acid adenylation domain-containing protein